MSTTVLKRSSVTINKKYAEYFLPTVLTAMATNITTIVDSVIAGNILGENALSAINLLSPTAQLYFSLTIMMGLGASSVIAVAKGKNDNRRVNRIFTTAFSATLLLSFLLMVVQLPFASQVCSLLTKDPTLHSLMYQYYIPFIIATPLNMLLLCSVYFIRIDNRPSFASGIIIVANSVNLVMDFVYMGVFDMGIAGSSIATLTGYAVGFLVMITHFISKKSSLKFDFSVFKEPKELFDILLNLIKVGLSGALGTLLITVKMFALNWIIQNTGGTSAVLSYSICSSSQIFMSMFVTGASQTMIPIVSVCVGEKDYDGVRYAFKKAFQTLLIASTIIMLFILVTPETFIRLFGVNSPSDIANTVPALCINVLSFPALAFSFLFLYYFMSIQRNTISTIIAVVNGIAIQIPAALILSQLFGIIGVWVSLVVAQVGTLVVVYFITLFIRKKSNGKYKSFYLLEESENNEIISLSFKATKENAAGASLYLSSFLTSRGIDKNKANRIAIAVEGIASDLSSGSVENKKKKPDVDIRIIIDGDDTIISIRDNSTLRYDSYEKEKQKMLSDLNVVESVSKSVEYFDVLGFNRIVIKI